jgi:hypothetical protein
MEKTVQELHNALIHSTTLLCLVLYEDQAFGRHASQLGKLLHNYRDALVYPHTDEERHAQKELIKTKLTLTINGFNDAWGEQVINNLHVTWNIPPF